MTPLSVEVTRLVAFCVTTLRTRARNYSRGVGARIDDAGEIAKASKSAPSTLNDGIYQKNAAQNGGISRRRKHMWRLNL